MDVRAKALPLLAIKDHISRDSAYRFGVLVGLRQPPTLTISDAFDMKHNTQNIDVSFVLKKLALIQTVSPGVGIVGLYACDENSSIPEDFKRQLIEADLQPLLFLAPSADSFQCFSLDSGLEIPWSLAPGESEVTAVSTVQNHANYTQKESGLNTENDANMGPSFRQLEEHVQAILACENAGADVEKHVVFLAHLVSRYKGKEPPENYEIQSSHLSLLEAQIATTNSALSQVGTHAAAIDKRGYRLLLEGWNKK